MVWVWVCGLIISLIMTLLLLITQLCYQACRRHSGKAYHLFYLRPDGSLFDLPCRYFNHISLIMQDLTLISIKSIRDINQLKALKGKIKFAKAVPELFRFIEN